MIHANLIKGVWDTEYPKGVFKKWTFTPERIEIYGNMPEMTYPYLVKEKQDGSYYIEGFGSERKIIVLEENKMILEDAEGIRQEFTKPLMRV